MPRGSCIWLLLAVGFISLLANSMWTKHQINEILARELTRDSQVCTRHGNSFCTSLTCMLEDWLQSIACICVTIPAVQPQCWTSELHCTACMLQQPLSPAYIHGAVV